MYQQNGLNAYRQVANTGLTDRDADATCFRLLIAELEKANSGFYDTIKRNDAIAKHQRLWSLIQKANAVDVGNGVSTEDRLLFVRLADQAQRYGIRAMLDHSLSLQPLITIAQTVLEGLQNPDPTSSW